MMGTVVLLVRVPTEGRVTECRSVCDAGLQTKVGEKGTCRSSARPWHSLTDRMDHGWVATGRGSVHLYLAQELRSHDSDMPGEVNSSRSALAQELLTRIIFSSGRKPANSLLRCVV